MKFLKVMTIGLMMTSAAFGSSIDTGKSQLNWLGTKVSGKHFGKLSFKSGKAEIKNDKLVGGEFVVDMNSLTVDDIKGEWAGKFLGHMKNDDFFNVPKYPTAKLKITSVKGDTASATLTIKGKSGPVKFTYIKKGNKLTGKLKFNRTKFGMKYGSGSFFKGLGDKMIHDEVSVDYKLVLKK